MSDTDIQRLRAEIAQLDRAIASLDGMAEAQAALREQRAAKAASLARLEGRAPSVHIDQSGQSGGVSFGAYNTFSGPVITGGIHSGRDTNVAGGDQTITNHERGDPSPAPAAEAEGLRGRLAQHRATLGMYLGQLATLSSAHAPPAVSAGIREARQEIRRIKARLRSLGQAVEDEMDDEG